MIDHETHLKQILEVQRELARELTDLNNLIASKKEQFSKYQGIVEYLTGNGIKLPENAEEQVNNEQES